MNGSCDPPPIHFKSNAPSISEEVPGAILDYWSDASVQEPAAAAAAKAALRLPRGYLMNLPALM